MTRAFAAPRLMWDCLRHARFTREAKNHIPAERHDLQASQPAYFFATGRTLLLNVKLS